MTMNEKRHFKIFFQKNNFGSQKKYFVLFDLINKYSTINEELIRRHFVEYDYSDKNISYDINYLNKIILKALSDFNSEKTISLKTKDNLMAIEILFYKGLFNECLKLISKTKKIIEKNENEHLMLELLEWEKKCLGYSSGFYAAQSINLIMDKYFERSVVNRKIVDLYYESYELKNKVGKKPLKEIKLDFDNLLNNELLLTFKSESSSIQSNIFFYLIYANFYHVNGKKEKELNFLENCLFVFDKNEYYKKENPLDYISIFNRIIDIYKKKDKDLFYKKIHLLRSFESILDFQKDVARERIFFHTHQAELDFLLYNDKIIEASLLMENIVYTLNNNKFKIESYYYLGLFYQFSCVSLLSKNFSKALKYSNLILNEYKLQDRPSTYIKTEIINILIHFNLENYKLVIYNLDNFKKKYRQTFKLNEFEKSIFKTIRKIAENPLISNKNLEIKSMLKKMICLIKYKIQLQTKFI